MAAKMTPEVLLPAIAGCIETTFAEEDRDPTCFTGIISGDGVTAQWAGECDESSACGMAWVRLVTAYPSVSPGGASRTPGNCNTGLGLDIEVGILRCVPIDVDPDANDAEVDALGTTLGILGDMAALRRALTCCTELPNSDFILGEWTPMGPLGGLVGGVWTLYVVL